LQLAINIKKFTSGKKAKETPLVADYLYVLQNIGVFIFNATIQLLLNATNPNCKR
jgi:hypothetical protein